MITFIVILSFVYLAGIGTQIAVAGRLYGKVKSQLVAFRAPHLPYRDYSALKPYHLKQNWLIGMAAASPFWPALLPLAIVGAIVGGAGWTILIGTKKLFDSQVAKVVAVETRKKELT